MNFFDPNHRTDSTLFQMGAPGHIALVLLMFGLLALLVTFRKDLGKLRQNRRFMAGTAGFVLTLELLSYALKFIYPCDPAFERIPLHLCASLKIAVAALILLERYDGVKYLSVWAIGAGFISFANLNMEGVGFGNFAFWLYIVGHLYIFLVPIFLFLTGEFSYDLKYHARSMAGLGVWSLVVFFINWAFDTNYMYTGPHNHAEVPFIPAQYMVWPFNYFSYVLTALVLLNLVYAIVRFFQGPGQQSAALVPVAVTEH